MGDVQRVLLFPGQPAVGRDDAISIKKIDPVN
jgi:hypothetical protein